MIRIQFPMERTNDPGRERNGAKTADSNRKRGLLLYRSRRTFRRFEPVSGRLQAMNQREPIPEGESSSKYAETPVGSLPTGVSFVAFCSFPGLPAFYPRMGQIWVKGKSLSTLCPEWVKMGQSSSRPICFPSDQELRRSKQRLRIPIWILEFKSDILRRPPQILTGFR